MASPLQVWRVSDFRGGRNTHSSPRDVAPNESPADNNVDGDIIGSLRRRSGFGKFSQTQYGVEPITGLYRYYRSDGEKWLMVFNGGVLWAGRGIPPDDRQIKTNFQRNTYMSFATMHDWCYVSNHLDEIHKFDGTNIIQAGLPPLSDPASNVSVPQYFPNFQSVSDSDGNHTQGDHKRYTFRYRYGRLGKSNLPTLGYDYGKQNVLDGLNGVKKHPTQVRSLPMVIAAAEDNAVQFTNLQLEPLGNSPRPSSGAVPTHIQIYRSLVSETVQNSSPDASASDYLNLLSYYFVAEIPLDNTAANNTYIDTFSDDEILDRYEGHRGIEIDRLMPKAKYLVEHRNRMFFLNCRIESDDPPDYPNRMWWSEINRPERIEDQLDVYAEDGDVITGAISFANTMLIFKRTKTYMLLGSSPSNFEIRIVNPGIGCVAANTIGVLDNRVIFLAVDGVYAFDGANFTRISEKIRPDILAIKKDARAFSAAGVNNGRYFLSFQEET